MDSLRVWLGHVRAGIGWAAKPWVAWVVGVIGLADVVRAVLRGEADSGHLLLGTFHFLPWAGVGLLAMVLIGTGRSLGFRVGCAERQKDVDEVKAQLVEAGRRLAASEAALDKYRNEEAFIREVVEDAQSRPGMRPNLIGWWRRFRKWSEREAAWFGADEPVDRHVFLNRYTYLVLVLRQAFHDALTDSVCTLPSLFDTPWPGDIGKKVERALLEIREKSRPWHVKDTAPDVEAP